MNLAESWRLLSDCIAQPKATPALAGGARSDSFYRERTWHALFSDRPRPLLLPVNNRRARRGGVRFFLPEVWRRFYAGARLRANDLFGDRARLPQFTLPPEESSTLSELLAPIETPQLAFLIGTSGPFQKASMLAMSSLGEPISLTKLALGMLANNMVANEAAWLKTLNACPAVRDSVPHLLREGSTLNGRRFLTQSVVQGWPSANSFGPAHAEFLRRLGSIDCRIERFSDARLRNSLQSSLIQLAPLLGHERRSALQAALSECIDRLSDWRGPSVISHGDFAYWNIRTLNDRILVFDWEYAATGSSPLFDLFHFYLIAPASSGRPLNARDMNHALAPARAFALLAYPEFEWSAPIVAAHGLAYLLHTLTFYGLSRGRFVELHPVVRSYNRLLEERSQWLQ
jgi:hypothetical protein